MFRKYSITGSRAAPSSTHCTASGKNFSAIRKGLAMEAHGVVQTASHTTATEELLRKKLPQMHCAAVCETYTDEQRQNKHTHTHAFHSTAAGVSAIFMLSSFCTTSCGNRNNHIRRTSFAQTTTLAKQLLHCYCLLLLFYSVLEKSSSGARVIPERFRVCGSGTQSFGNNGTTNSEDERPGSHW